MPINEYDDIVSNLSNQALPQAPAPAQAPTSAPISGGYDQFINEYKNDKVPAVSQSMYATSDLDPEREAKVQSLTIKSGLPKSVVSDNYDELAKQYEVIKPSPEQIVESTPGLATWLENPDNAAISSKELPQLGIIDKGISFLGDLKSGAAIGWNELAASTAVLGGAYGFSNMKDAAQTIYDYKKRSSELAKLSPSYMSEFEKLWQKEGGDINKSARQVFDGFSEIKKNEILKGLKNIGIGSAFTIGESVDLLTQILTDSDKFKGAIYEVSRNAANSLPTLGLSSAAVGISGVTSAQAGPFAPIAFAVSAPFAAATGAFLGTAVTEVGSSLMEQMQKTGVDFNDISSIEKAISDPKFIEAAKEAAQRRGVAVGTVEALFGSFAGHFTHGAFKKSGIVNKIAAFSTDLAVESTGEALGEFGGQVAENKGDLSKVDPASAIREGIAALFQSAGQVVIGAGTSAIKEKISDERNKYSSDTARAAEEAVKDAHTAQQSISELQVVAEVAKAAKEAKTTSEVKGKISELVDVAGGDGKTILFQIDDWDKYWNEQNKSPSDAANEAIEDNGVEYSNARKSGGDIQIPLGKFIENIARTQHLDPLLTIARTSPDGMTLTEAKTVIEELPAVLNKLVEEANTEAPVNDTVRNFSLSVEKQFMAAGYTRKQAKAHADLAKGNLLARAAIMGVSPESLISDKPLTIQTAESVPGQALQQSEEDYTKPKISKLGLYWKVEKEIIDMDFNDMPAKDLVGRINNLKGIKPHELELLGLMDFLKARDGKVSKKEVIDFIRGNGFQLEQVVLGDVPRGSVGDGPRVSDLSWGEPRLFSLHEIDPLGDLVSDEMHYYLKENEDWLKENTEELRTELISEYTTNDVVDEVGLEKAIKDGLKDRAREAAEESLSSEDSYYAQFELEEESTGWTLTGSDERGWYNPESDKYFNTSLEEAKVQLVADMIRKGAVAGDISELLKEEEIKFREPVGKAPDRKTIVKKAKALAKKDFARLDAIARNKYAWEYEGKDGSELEKVINDNVQNEAEDEIRNQYNDPSLPRNSVTVRINNPILEGRIQGSNQKGYSVTYELPGRNEATHQLVSKTLDEAKKEFIQLLKDNGLLAKKFDEIKEVNINTPTRSGKWKNFNVASNPSNYRVFAVTAPSVTPEFIDENLLLHLGDVKNAVGHIRVHDGIINENGADKKVLYVDEFQSDWEAAIREKGARNEALTTELYNKREEARDKRGVVEDRLRDELKKYNADDTLRKILDAVKFETEGSALSKVPEEIRGISEIISLIAEYDKYNKDVNSIGREFEKERSKPPQSPYYNTEMVNAILLKQAIRIAVQDGYDAIAWSPSEIQYRRWKTDLFRFKKVEGGWLVEVQKAANPVPLPITVEGVNAQRGELNHDDHKVISTQAELNKEMDKIGASKFSKEEMWKRMQAENEGVIAPRQSGFIQQYDKQLPGKVASAVLKPLDKSARVEVKNVDFLSGESQDSWYIELTPGIKKSIAEQGQSYLQSGGGVVRGFFDPSRNTIGILKDANLSTGLHELGHYFFKNMESDVKTLQSFESLTDGQKDFLERSNTLLNMLGIDSWDKATVEHQEKLARAFEEYLMTGEAPTSALRKAFAMFKTWLFNIYKALGWSGVEINQELRDVFDRLIATDEEVDAAQEKQNMIPLFSDPRFAGMSEEQTKRYLTAQFEAGEAAKNKISAKVNNDYRKKQERAYKDRYSQIKSDVIEQVNSNKVYMAMSLLSRNKMPDGSEPPSGHSAIKLSKSDVVSKLGKESLLKLPRGTYSVKDGIDIDIAAGILGFNTGKDLVESISNAPKYSDYVTKITEERISSEHPELLTIDEIPEEALKEIHNSKRAEMLRMEIEHLASNNLPVLKGLINQIARRPPSRKFIKEQALNSIGAMPASNIKASSFLRAERKSANEAASLFAKGDINGALEAKVSEALNHELFIAANEAGGKVEKALERFKKYSRKDEDISKTRDMDLVNAGRAILGRLGLISNDSAPIEYLGKLERYAPDAHYAMTNLIDSSVPPGKTFDKLSYSEFTDVANALDSIWDLARSEKKISIGKQELELSDVIDSLSATVEALTNYGKLNYNKSVTNKDRNIVGLYSLAAKFKRMEHWAFAMGGDFTKVMFNPISEKADEYRAKRANIESRFLDLIQTVGQIDTGPIHAPNLNFTFSNKGHLLGAMLHSGNESNLTKLLVGYGWGSVNEEGKLDSSEWKRFLLSSEQNGIITEADWRFVQGVWDMMDELKPSIQEAHRKMYGYYFSEVTSDEVETSFGKFRGGYFPARTETLIVRDSAMRAEQEALEMHANSFAFPTAGTGPTKQRIDGYAAPLSLDIGMALRHMDWALRFSTLMPQARQIAKIVWNKDFRRVLDNFDPGIASELLIPWLQRSVSQSVTTPSSSRSGQVIDNVARHLRAVSGARIMFLSASNAIQQFTGLSAALIKVGGTHLSNSMWAFVRDRKSMINFAIENSEFMKGRVGSNVFEVSKEISNIVTNPNEFETVRDFLKKHAYILQGLTQGIVDNIIWNASYNESVSNGLNHDESVRAADSAVRTTQGSFNAEDISSFEVGTPTYRMFTMFYSFFNNQANLHASEFSKTIRSVGLKDGAGRLFYVYLTGFAAVSIMSEAIKKAFSGKLDEDEDEEYIDDVLDVLVGSQARSFAAMFPVVGQAGISILNQFNDKPFDDRISLSPIFSLLESGLRAPKSVTKYLESGEGGKRAIVDSFTLVELLTGAPLTPISRPLGFIQNVREGKSEPEGVADFARGLITGK